jgi:hypothetical protein
MVSLASADSCEKLLGFCQDLPDACFPGKQAQRCELREPGNLGHIQTAEHVQRFQAAETIKVFKRAAAVAPVAAVICHLELRQARAWGQVTPLQGKVPVQGPRVKPPQAR